ncbi:unnamed protein product [Rotaria socialis]|uniref:CCHC-type domain-containing protein n=1 Tax=Rotaria socialis TaxID=392032 RepID=A0A820BD11_9BILA|nr:unnamed protein product [Rotaria socialis]CAF4204225.1 unnamed protein product [Rotaria socialis]
MNGTRRTQSRHIRIDIYNKDEQTTLLNSGIITLGGMQCEIDEYLPAPKRLVCMKCHVPGHARKTCRFGYERCRRCGKDRTKGSHKECKILCHHCGDNHQATDYKWSVLNKFRRDLIDELRKNPNKLPPDMQMFIPLDCRTQRSEKNLSNQNTNKSKKSDPDFAFFNSSYDWPTLGKTLNSITYDSQIKNVQNDLTTLKHEYKLEIEKNNNKTQHHSLRTQKEISAFTSSIVNDLTLNMNINVIKMISNFLNY